ncbi:MAG: hypothetical protein II574_05500, partial [Ruminococcus sp.]|nr:hypothetical protein [Ruminococcus sp.]
MSSRRTHQKEKKPQVAKRVGLIIALIALLAALGVLIWLTVQLVSDKSSSSSDTPLKKSSVPDTTTRTTTTTTAATTTTQTAKPVPSVVDLAADYALDDAGNVVIKWQAADGADGYIVYRQQSDTWEQIATVEGKDNTSFTDKTAERGNTYSYKVAAYAGAEDVRTLGGESHTVVVDLVTDGEKANLYELPKGVQVFNEKLQLVYTIENNDEIGYYTGIPDTLHDGYLEIDFMLTKRYVKASAVKQVEGAVALPTSVIGQEGGRIFGTSACGPTAAVVLALYDKGLQWDKDELIIFSEKNNLCDQGSMSSGVGEGGMSAPMVIKMISMYSNGELTAKNLYSDKEKPSDVCKKLIDQGKHSILSVRYAWGI